MIIGKQYYSILYMYIMTNIWGALDHASHAPQLISGTVQPRLSGTSIIRTSRRPENTLPRMRRRRDQ